MDLRKITWIAHCEARAEWEKSLNITQRSKRPSRRGSGSRTSRRSRQSVNTPISPRLPHSVYAPSLWLIWTSSNFLHSGSWTHHRSVILHTIPTIDFSSFFLSLNLDLIIHPALSHNPVPYDYFNVD
ncbi:hypothetical protein C1645_815036 [Glomus cerebriforme]|uniref:Uncharacterized protein n=1 Tax=Glomus cerebriforme TaxID=658196 RepID=A0A397TH80_9GLOM|nr:hypothetical protein C1645_815036 [Glomus cerebriforme]